MRYRCVALVLVAGLAGGCVAPTAVTPSGSQAQVPTEVLQQADRAMSRFYRLNALEKDGRCRAPYFDGILERVVLEDSEQFLRLQVRYAYRDEIGNDSGRRLPFATDRCRGQNEREFVLARTPDEGLEVLVMTGTTKTSGTPTLFN